MKRKDSVFFWLIAITVMVFAMCVLSLQIINLHQEKDLERFKRHDNVYSGEKLTLNDLYPEQESQAAPEVPAQPQVATAVAQPRVLPSKKIRTPKTIREYERTLYDVPHDGKCGFWALLRGLNPEDELIHVKDIADLKKKAAKCALKTELGPSRQEVRKMFFGDAPLDTAMLPYVSHAVERDVIVSSNEIPGFDLFTKDGETFHYDTIDEINKEAEKSSTVWLHNISNVHWTVAIPNPDEDEKEHDAYYLVSEGEENNKEQHEEKKD